MRRLVKRELKSEVGSRKSEVREEEEVERFRR
jgi:hypothetical protein